MPSEFWWIAPLNFFLYLLYNVFCWHFNFSQIFPSMICFGFTFFLLIPLWEPLDVSLANADKGESLNFLLWFLSFLSTIFVPCSSVGCADCLAVFLLLVCLKKNLLLVFMPLTICFSNFLGPPFCFLHLTCRSFRSFLFSSSGTTSASWILLWNRGQNGDWLLYQAAATGSVSSTRVSAGRRVQFHHFSMWLLEVLLPHSPQANRSPWEQPGCFCRGNCGYRSALPAVTASAGQSKGRQIKKKRNNLCRKLRPFARVCKRCSACTAELANGSSIPCSVDLAPI